MQTPAPGTEPGAGSGRPSAEIPEPFVQLLAQARDVASRAYAPYSGFAVGAAACTSDGRIVSGCNVENAGYGVTLCAECGMVSEMIAGGGGKLRWFVCVGGPADGDRERPIVMPCGRCRQLLAEHATDDFTILTPSGPASLEQILPLAFGPRDLEN